MTDNRNSKAGGVAALLAIMARLRDPENGCPWDVAQTFETIAPYTIEDTRDIRNMDVYSRLAHMVGPA
jgi:uncharacterized protein YabN with tetrapyrrole methylase and pyrophosphatase domain